MKVQKVLNVQLCDTNTCIDLNTQFVLNIRMERESYKYWFFNIHCQCRAIKLCNCISDGGIQHQTGRCHSVKYIYEMDRFTAILFDKFANILLYCHFEIKIKVFFCCPFLGCILTQNSIGQCEQIRRILFVENKIGNWGTLWL